MPKDTLPVLLALLCMAALQSSWNGCPVFAQANGLRNGLPPCRTDSFVYEAKEQAENIYGDETVPSPGQPERFYLPPGVSPTPYDGFTKEHRINSGIFAVRAAGLTTGHGSYMPDAAGQDEFIGNEWSVSGAGAAAVTGLGAMSGFISTPSTAPLTVPIPAVLPIPISAVRPIAIPAAVRMVPIPAVGPVATPAVRPVSNLIQQNVFSQFTPSDNSGF